MYLVKLCKENKRCWKKVFYSRFLSSVVCPSLKQSKHAFQLIYQLTTCIFI